MDGQPPSVSIAFAAIHRQLHENGHDGIFLKFRPAGPAEPRDVTAAIEQANASVEAETV